MNSLLFDEHTKSIPIVSWDRTLILGMDVSHGPPGLTDIPSIAVVMEAFLCVLKIMSQFMFILSKY
jgi:eukaryotic translation initiation factor 2C